MKINAVFCKKCNCIIHSRATHDLVSCNCKNVSIDGGQEYVKVNGNPNDYIHLILNKNKYLQLIFNMDYKYGNKNAHKWIDGYYGKFVIDSSSNNDFYKEFIKNYKDVERIFNDIVKR